MSAKTATVHTDGASRGNPGPYGCAFVMRIGGQAQPIVGTKYLGDRGTVNEAEYEAIILAIENALLYGVEKLQVISDSKLVVEQLLGSYEIKKPHLWELAQKVMDLVHQLPMKPEIHHVKRFENREADGLVTKMLDEKTGSKRKG